MEEDNPLNVDSGAKSLHEGGLTPLFPVQVGQEPVGGRLAHYWKNWQTIGADYYVVEVLRKGMRIQFQEPPPLTNSPVDIRLPSLSARREGLLDLVEDLLLKRVIEKVMDTNSMGFYNHFFVVPKSSGKWRPILDLKNLNLYVLKESFKMESAELIRGQLKSGDWVTSLDLAEAYHHIPVHRASRKYLRFSIEGTVYQYRAMPMGLTSSPRIFTRVIQVVKGYVQAHAVEMFQYLDDWLIRTRTIAEAARNTADICKLVVGLGWMLNKDKSELKPSQEVTFLGYRLKLKEGLVSPTQERWSKVQELVQPFIVNGRLPARAWQSLIGLLVATEKLVDMGMLHIRPLQFALAESWSMANDDQDVLVTITQEVRQCVIWWTVWDNVMKGVPLSLGVPQFQIFTDASMIGWGGHLDNIEVKGVWTEEERKMHINCLEMLAVLRVLKALQHKVMGTFVLVCTDNSTVVAYLRKQGGTRSRELFNLTQEVLDFVQTMNITLRIRHIAGRLNVLADGLSRGGQIVATEWAIHPHILEKVWRYWDKPLIDMFATKHNYKMMLYISPVPDPAAMAVDALSVTWEGLYGYAFPPTAIIHKVLQKVTEETCTIILIAPLWPKQIWFPRLLDLLVELPFQLPTPWNMLKQPKSTIYHNQPEVYRLHAWKLSSNNVLKRDFQKRLQAGLLEPRSLQPWECIKGSGESSLVGVRDGMQIHSLQLLSW